VRGTLEEWQRLRACPALVEAAGRLDAVDAAAVVRLRRAFDVALVPLALDLATARRAAREKWPGREVWADPEGVQMATDAIIGAHKARRFVEVGIARVDDLCCGIGGDAMALAAAGVEVVGVDRSDVRAWMCALNAGCETRVAEVGEVEVGGAFHLDPSRRVEGVRRVWRYDELEPGPDVIERLARGTGAIKLGPGVDLERLAPGEVEMISVHGTLTQAVLWTGGLARVERRATVLPSGASMSGVPVDAALSAPGRYVHAVDPAVERAGLMGVLSRELGAPALHPSLGLLTSDEPVESAFVRSFLLRTRMAWREARVRDWLRAHDGGIVEVKTRGKVVDPDRVQGVLRGEGNVTYTVFVLRFGSRVEALIAERVGEG